MTTYIIQVHADHADEHRAAEDIRTTLNQHPLLFVKSVHIVRNIERETL